MAKPLLIIIISILCCSNVAKAQSDTSNYDLGRILVKKQFTQNITVKAHDLEQYQFSDLAEAINTYFYGTYSNSLTQVYVIDGNIINDVNAYSIYDIDEITLVQNALGQVSGASPGQQIILIKLKTDKPGKQGITAAGQTDVVGINNKPDGEKSNSNIYNQYYVSGYKNFDDFNVGLSADYQRDVFPQIISKYSSSAPPFNFNRIKLNLWGTAKLLVGNLTIGVNFAPQTSNIADSYNLYNNADDNYSESVSNNGHISQHLFNMTIALKSNIIQGLTNNFSEAYNLYNYFQKYNADYIIPDYYMSPGGNMAEYIDENFSASRRTTNLLLRDEVVYTENLGDFGMQPSLNFSFRDVNTSFNYDGFDNVGTGDSNTSRTINSFNFNGTAEFKTFLITPSMNVVYKRFLNVQAGFVGTLSSNRGFNNGYSSPWFSPFFTVSADVTKIPAFNNFHLKVFGSFARQNQLLNDKYTSLAGFAIADDPFMATTLLGTSSVSNLPTYSYNYSTNPYQQYNNYQAGLALNIPRNFSISYSFEYHNYETLLTGFIPVDQPQEQTTLLYVNDKTITNRAGLNYYLTTGNFSWKTGLNAAESKLLITDSKTLALTPNFNDYFTNGHRWSGGFTNRFDYNTFFVGFDILYQIGARPFPYGSTDAPIVNNNNPASNVNYFSLQNLYIGTSVNIPYLKHANVFLSGRNILQNGVSNIVDNRRYFGFGFKAGM